MTTADAFAHEAAAITAFWTGLGLDGLVDVHTHFMPPNVMAKVWAYFDRAQKPARRPGRSSTG